MRFLALFTVILVACGGKYKDTQAESQEILFGNQRVQVLSGTIQLSGTNLSGSGEVLFPAQNESFQSSTGYELKFSLEDSGSIILLSHASPTLAGAFALEFYREQNQLKVFLRAQGASFDASSNFSGIDASNTIHVKIDVHNDESPAHILVWNGQSELNLQTALLNTADEIDGSPGIGTGSRWGLRLQNASVSLASAGEANLSH